MKFFTKPWAMTTVMFLGMSFCLPWAYWQEHKHKKQAREALLAGNGAVRDPLLVGDSLVSSGYIVLYICHKECWQLARLVETLCLHLTMPPAQIILYTDLPAPVSNTTKPITAGQ